MRIIIIAECILRIYYCIWFRYIIAICGSKIKPRVFIPPNQNQNIKFNGTGMLINRSFRLIDNYWWHCCDDRTDRGNKIHDYNCRSISVGYHHRSDGLMAHRKIKLISYFQTIGHKILITTFRPTEWHANHPLAYKSCVFCFFPWHRVPFQSFS